MQVPAIGSCGASGVAGVLGAISLQGLQLGGLRLRLNPPYGLACSMASAIFSAVIRTGKLVLAHGTTGNIDAL